MLLNPSLLKCKGGERGCMDLEFHRLRHSYPILIVFLVSYRGPCPLSWYNVREVFLQTAITPTAGVGMTRRIYKRWGPCRSV